MQNTQNNIGRAAGFFKKKDLIVIAAVLALAGALFLFWFLTRTPAGTAQITVITPGGQTVQTVSLQPNRTLNIEDGALPVTLQIEDGRIRFIHSVCPDHLCEGFGWLGHEGEEAICLPAGVWVRVTEGGAVS